jgi:hypothetical protein
LLFHGLRTKECNLKRGDISEIDIPIPIPIKVERLAAFPKRDGRAQFAGLHERIILEIHVAVEVAVAENRDRNR